MTGRRRSASSPASSERPLGPLARGAARALGHERSHMCPNRDRCAREPIIEVETGVRKKRRPVRYQQDALSGKAFLICRMLVRAYPGKTVQQFDRDTRPGAAFDVGTWRRACWIRAAWTRRMAKLQSGARCPPRKWHMHALTEKAVHEDELVCSPTDRLDSLLCNKEITVQQGHLRRVVRLRLADFEPGLLHRQAKSLLEHLQRADTIPSPPRRTNGSSPGLPRKLIARSNVISNGGIATAAAASPALVTMSCGSPAKSPR